MTRVTASAPGKVIVSGEYAVLDGAPAICMAVNRRARVSIVAADASRHTVSAPGYLGKSRTLRINRRKRERASFASGCLAKNAESHRKGILRHRARQPEFSDRGRCQAGRRFQRGGGRGVGGSTRSNRKCQLLTLAVRQRRHIARCRAVRG